MSNYVNEFVKLGKRYKKLRLERNMTQEDVQEHGISVRHYQKLESGRPHSVMTLCRVSKMFSVDPEIMIKGIFNVKGPPQN